MNIYWQEKVTGIIYDENSVPLPGVSVIIENTTTTAITDFDGKYEIDMQKDTDKVYMM